MLYSILFLSYNQSYSQSCPQGVGAELVIDFGEFTVGCAPAYFCIDVFNPSETEPTDDFLISLVRSTLIQNPATAGLEALVPEDIGDFVENGADEFFNVFSLPPNEETGGGPVRYCLGFSVDPNLPGPIITEIVLTGEEGCEEFRFPLTLTPTGGITLIDENETASLSNLIQLQQLVPANQSANQIQDIVVKGTLMIDVEEEYTFPNGSQIRMANGGRIVVEENSHLNLIGASTFVRGCFDMWNSIEVENGGALTIGAGVEVEGGIRAISALPGSSIDIQGANFENNQVSLYSDGGDGNNWTIQNNTFISDELLPPFAGQIARAGVEVENTLGVVILINNDFGNMANGILASRANLFVAGGSFRNMQTNGDHNIQGYGIRAFGQGHLLLQIGKGKDLENPTFRNCRDAIFTFGMNTFSSNNGIEEVRRGIRVYNAKFNGTSLLDNIISAREIGVESVGNQPQLTGSDMRRNDILIDGDLESSVGIKLKEFPIGNGFIIDENRIEMNNAMFGVDASGISNTTFSRNGIRLENEAFMRGMNIEGSTDLDITCNRVSSTTEDLAAQRSGIFATSLPNSNLECNSFDNLRFGIHLYDMNDNTFLKGNEFDDYFNGLLLGRYPDVGNANIPQQIDPETGEHFGNIWLGNGFNSQTSGAVYLSDIDEDILLSRFFVNPSANSDFLPPNSQYSTPLSDENWFFSEPAFTFQCPNTSACPDLSSEEWIPNEMDENIVNAPYFSAEYEAAQRWKAQSHLYRRLKQHPQWTEENSEFGSFVQNEESNATSLSQLNNFIYEMNFVAEGNAPVSDNVTFLKNNVADLANLINSNDGVLPSSATVENILASIGNVQNALIIDYQNYVTGVASNLSSIGSNLDVIVSENYDENLQVVESIYLSSINDFSENGYTAEQTNQLETIAYQCPLSGGDAVYYARGMLGITIADDAYLCNTKQKVIVSPNNTATPNIANFKAFPNPTDDHFTILLGDEIKGQITVRLVNSFGQVVTSLQENIDFNNKIDLHVGDIPNGMYMIEVVPENEPPQTKTIQIIK